MFGDDYPDHVRARAPASSANLGPGFDTLALALDRHVEVEVEPASHLIVRSEGEGAGLSDDPSHLAARVAIDVAGHDRLAITVRSNIPIGRGLGSSAALAVAAAAAAGARDPLAVASQVDGHPDNAAASVVGGLIASTVVRGEVQVVRLPLDPGLVFVLIVPELTLATGKARQILPNEVTREHAAFNLGRLAFLIAGLADHRLLLKEATEDRLHQDYRSPLFPAAPTLLSRMSLAGALAVCWSGAGPSLLGICTVSNGAQVQAATRAVLAEVGVAGEVLLLRPDMEGLVVGDEGSDSLWQDRNPTWLRGGAAGGREAPASNNPANGGLTNGDSVVPISANSDPALNEGARLYDFDADR
jgi:homoserine kinase